MLWTIDCCSQKLLTRLMTRQRKKNVVFVCNYTFSYSCFDDRWGSEPRSIELPVEMLPSLPQSWKPRTSFSLVYLFWNYQIRWYMPQARAIIDQLPSNIGSSIIYQLFEWIPTITINSFQINGTNVLELSHNEVVALIQDLPMNFRLVVARKREEDDEMSSREIKTAGIVTWWGSGEGETP